MNKRKYNGIQMEVTRYNPAKELMRRGLVQAIEDGRFADNQTKLALETINHIEARIKMSEYRRCALFFG